MQNCYRNMYDIFESVLNTANGNEVIQLEILSKANVTQITQGVLFILLEFNLIEYMQKFRT